MATLRVGIIVDYGSRTSWLTRATIGAPLPQGQSRPSDDDAEFVGA
jgi:hypothetical protein